MQLSQLCCLELCAGAGRLSSHLRQSGFITVSVDHVTKRAKPLHKSLRLDLSKPSSAVLLRDLFASHTVCYVHAALPYGTCKRSRSAVLPKHLRLCKVSKARALRSISCPEGVPDMNKEERLRVQCANQIFRNVCSFMSLCCLSNVRTSLENPSNSLLWHVPCVKKLVERFGLFEVKFQQCMWGGSTAKWTTILTNCPELACLAKSCDGDHVHRSSAARRDAQGKDTAAYPPKLCAAIADAISLAVRSDGAVGDAVESNAPSASPKLQQQVDANKQPRGDKLPPVISEVVDCRWLRWGDSKPPQASFKLDQHMCTTLGVPFPSKVLRWRVLEGCPASSSASSGLKSAGYEVYVGTYRSPQQFVEEALLLQHPFDSDVSICDDLKVAIFRLLTLGPSAVRAEQTAMLDHYTQRAQELESKEKLLHEQLSESRQRVVLGKRFLLLSEMARDAGIRDPELCRCQVVGTSLVGEQPPCPLFAECRRDATLSVPQLMHASKWSRAACNERSDAVDDSLASHLWDEALREVEVGWLQGPLSEAQVSELLGPLFVVSPRFGLRQHDKIRAIDDLSCSLVNMAFASTSKLELGGVDDVAVLARTILECIRDDRSVRVKLSGGPELVGVLSEELSLQDARCLVGRTLDLEHAYKQCLVSLASLWASVLGIVGPSGSRELFISHVLPFGACASVYSFNRVARALHIIGIRLFGLIWCNYYDDFPHLSLECSGASDHGVAESFLALVGWRYSTKEKKRQPFKRCFDALGVTFDFECSDQGVIVLKNKVGRVEQIVDEIDVALSKGCLTQPHAASLMGRLHFAESQLFGRATLHRMRMCHARASGSESGTSISVRMSEELHWAKSFLANCPPRQVRTRTAGCPAVIFTDASLEDQQSVASVGGVFYQYRAESSVQAAPCFFSAAVPSNALQCLQRDTKHVIAALEMLAVVIAVQMWGPLLSSKRCFFFVDNDSARGALIACYSPSLQLGRLVTVWSELSTARSLFPWVCRVPSPSNIADAPSRGCVTDLVKLGASQHQVCWDIVLGWLHGE